MSIFDQIDRASVFIHGRKRTICSGSTISSLPDGSILVVPGDNPPNGFLHPVRYHPSGDVEGFKLNAVGTTINLSR